MLEPRKIPPATVGLALKQAQHYRLLNEPSLAESICRDILAVDSDHEEAWMTLLLALTDQFDDRKSFAFDEAVEVLDQLSNEYKRCYYAGIIYERWGRAQLKLGFPRESVHPWMRKAMSLFMLAGDLAPENDPNPLLRWNTCARFLLQAEQHPTFESVAPSHRETHHQYDDDVPFR